ncbi:hypothetical protein WN944_022480 [Citrus x changshan-huyou]|uniref:Uncharacterized protein n=1 Tax=Citrus x changshan-huyou TaxID=2935761 RepID=A0AAP0MYK7_9ROSI
MIESGAYNNYTLVQDPLLESRKRSLALTWLLMVLIYFGSTMIPNIWTAFKFTGATTAVSLGFIVPPLVALRLRKEGPGLSLGEKFLLGLMLVLAIVELAKTMSAQILDWIIVFHVEPLFSCLIVMYGWLLTHYLIAKAIVAACIGAEFGIDGNPGELPKWYAIVVVLFFYIYVAGFAWSWGPLGCVLEQAMPS